jgi:hypothetical protein
MFAQGLACVDCMIAVAAIMLNGRRQTAREPAAEAGA